MLKNMPHPYTTIKYYCPFSISSFIGDSTENSFYYRQNSVLGKHFTVVTDPKRQH